MAADRCMKSAGREEGRHLSGPGSTSGYLHPELQAPPGNDLSVTAQSGPGGMLIYPGSQPTGIPLAAGHQLSTKPDGAPQAG